MNEITTIYGDSQTDWRFPGPLTELFAPAEVKYFPPHSITTFSLGGKFGPCWHTSPCVSVSISVSHTKGRGVHTQARFWLEAQTWSGMTSTIRHDVMSMNAPKEDCLLSTFAANVGAWKLYRCTCQGEIAENKRDNSASHFYSAALEMIIVLVWKTSSSLPCWAATSKSLWVCLKRNVYLIMR